MISKTTRGFFLVFIIAIVLGIGLVGYRKSVVFNVGTGQSESIIRIFQIILKREAIKQELAREMNRFNCVESIGNSIMFDEDTYVLFIRQRPYSKPSAIFHDISRLVEIRSTLDKDDYEEKFKSLLAEIRELANEDNSIGE